MVRQCHNVIKNYNEESDAGYFFIVDVQYPKKVCKLHNGLLILPESRKACS